MSNFWWTKVGDERLRIFGTLGPFVYSSSLWRRPSYNRWVWQSTYLNATRMGTWARTARVWYSVGETITRIVTLFGNMSAHLMANEFKGWPQMNGNSCMIMRSGTNTESIWLIQKACEMFGRTCYVYFWVHIIRIWKIYKSLSSKI